MPTKTPVWSCVLNSMGFVWFILKDGEPVAEAIGKHKEPLVRAMVDTLNRAEKAEALVDHSIKALRAFAHDRAERGGMIKQ